MCNPLQDTFLTHLNNGSQVRARKQEVHPFSKHKHFCRLTGLTDKTANGFVTVVEVLFFCSIFCRITEKCLWVNQSHLFCCVVRSFSWEVLLPCGVCPTRQGWPLVLEGASSRGLGAEIPYPALNQMSEGQAKMPRLQSQSWMRHVCMSVSGTVSADSAHYWGSSEWEYTAPGYKRSPGFSSSRHWTSPTPHLEWTEANCYLLWQKVSGKLM